MDDKYQYIIIAIGIIVILITHVVVSGKIIEDGEQQELAEYECHKRGLGDLVKYDPKTKEIVCEQEKENIEFDTIYVETQTEGDD